MPNLLSTIQQQGVDVFGGVWPLVIRFLLLITDNPLNRSARRPMQVRASRLPSTIDYLRGVCA